MRIFVSTSSALFYSHIYANRIAVLSGYAGLDANSKIAASAIPAALPLNKTTLSTFDNTSPADGDLWFDGSALKFRLAGTTKTVTLT